MSRGHRSILAHAALAWLAPSLAVFAQTGVRPEPPLIELRAGCRLSGLPLRPALSVSWIGACRDGNAEGAGEVFGFVAGRPVFILRGEFAGGMLLRQDALRDCTVESCADDIPPAMLSRHLRETEAERAAAAAAAAPAVAAPTPLPSAAAATAAPGSPPLQTGQLPVQPAVAAVVPPATPAAPAAASAVPEREIRVANALFSGRFTTDPRDSTISGEGRVDYSDGARYEGAIVRGIKVGRGTYRWPNGMQYQGEWRDDQPDGQGTLAYPNGDVYEGAFVRGERIGRGILRQANGDVYEGEWVNGQRQGSGVATFANGQRYDGQWRADRKEGRGVMIFPDGSRYEGDWREDRAVGQGDILFPSGDAYTGEVRDGLPHGRGIYRWGSGDRFEGEFENGKPTERGKTFFAFDVPQPAAPAEPTQLNTTPLPAAPAPIAVDDAAVRKAQCFTAFNAANTQAALRRFLEQFPDDECQRHPIARQKLAALVERERAASRAVEERQALARSFIGATVAFTQDFPFCVVGSGADCQRVTYTFNVTAKIRDIDVQRRTATVQVADATSLGQRGTPSPLFAQGRAAATEAFRARVVGSTQTRTLAEIGLAF